MWFGVVQFGLSGDGRLVDPVGSEALDEDIERGLFAGGAKKASLVSVPRVIGT